MNTATARLQRDVHNNNRRHLLERYLRIIVDAAHAPRALRHLDPRRLEFAPFLQRREAPTLLELLFPRFALRLLAARVRQTRTRLRM